MIWIYTAFPLCFDYTCNYTYNNKQVHVYMYIVHAHTHRYVSTAGSLVTGWVSAPLTPPPLASASSVALQNTPVSSARRKSQQVPLTGCRDVLSLQYIYSTVYYILSSSHFMCSHLWQMLYSNYECMCVHPDPHRRVPICQMLHLQ